MSKKTDAYNQVAKLAKETQEVRKGKRDGARNEALQTVSALARDLGMSPQKLLEKSADYAGKRDEAAINEVLFQGRREDADARSRGVPEIQTARQIRQAEREARQADKSAKEAAAHKSLVDQLAKERAAEDAERKRQEDAVRTNPIAEVARMHEEYESNKDRPLSSRHRDPRDRMESAQAEFDAAVNRVIQTPKKRRGLFG